MSEGNKNSTLRHRLARISKFLKSDIWRAHHEESPRHDFLYTALRVLLIFWRGIVQNRIASQAASLSFSTLIGLGPILALGVMISGFVFKEADTDTVTRGIDRIIQFIAPPAVEFDKLNQADPAAMDDFREINPQVIRVIEQIIESSRSGTVGIAGIALLIIIGIQLLTSIENSFNSIWGIRKGRPLNQKILLYWSLITLGAIIGFALLSMQLVTAAEKFLGNIPLIGKTLLSIGLQAGPLISFSLLVLLLALFFRFIPNTQVAWIPALMGSVVVGLLLYLNNYLSFLYIQRVVVNQSLYGSIAIIPILMIGLYIFWLFILIGGQITYAIQNVRVLTSQNAWVNSSIYAQETVSLAALVSIARNFQTCRRGPTAFELAHKFKVPAQIINLCLERLEEMDLVSAVEIGEGDQSRQHHYQPARPLDKIDVESFRRKFSRLGNNQGADRIEMRDALLQWYHQAMTSKRNSSDQPPDLESLLRRFPEESGHHSPAVSHEQA